MFGAGVYDQYVVIAEGTWKMHGEEVETRKFTKNIFYLYF